MHKDRLHAEIYSSSVSCTGSHHVPSQNSLHLAVRNSLQDLAKSLGNSIAAIMASLRRTKNLASDPQTPMFLYTILKQLDLRSINWNDVADSLDISNGHAARMRYSRMKSQFEGLCNQPKPPKPKKENTGEGKPSKSKAKNNKRLLMDEENERIANSRPGLESTMQQEPDPKRVKAEPQSYMSSWNSNMYAGYGAQPYANTYWSQPMIKAEPSQSGIQHVQPQTFRSVPTIKTEPGTSEGSIDGFPVPVPAIKQEPNAVLPEVEIIDSDPIVVKREPYTNLAQQTSPVMTHTTDVTSSYPLSRTINTYFDRQQVPVTVTQPGPSFHALSAYSTPQTYLTGAYPTVNAYDPAHNGFSWPGRTLSQRVSMATADDGSCHLTLNPYAATYQDMLNMPLQRRSSSIVQIPDPSVQQIASQQVSTNVQQVRQEHDTVSNELLATSSTPEQLTLANTRSGAIGEAVILSPDAVLAQSEPTPSKSSTQQATTTATVIGVESAAEVEAVAALVPTIIDDVETKIKTEVVEL